MDIKRAYHTRYIAPAWVLDNERSGPGREFGSCSQAVYKTNSCTRWAFCALSELTDHGRDVG